MSKSIGAANEPILPPVPITTVTSEPLDDDNQAKSCCCACCAPCWTSFTDWLSTVWEAIKPCCTATGKIAGNVAIKIGEDALKTKIMEAPNLTDKQKEILMSALTKTANDLTKGINDPSSQVVVNIFATAAELFINGATDKAVTAIDQSTLSATQKEILIGALERASKIAIDVIDDHVHPAEISHHIELNIDNHAVALGGKVVQINIDDHAIPLGGDAVFIHEGGHA